MKWFHYHVHVGMKMKLRKRNATYCFWELCHWTSSQAILISVSLAKKIMLCTRGENKGNLGKFFKLFLCTLKLMHLCIRNLYYFIVSYCVLVAVVYFPCWTHLTIPSEKNIIILIWRWDKDLECLSCTRQHHV